MSASFPSLHVEGGLISPELIDEIFEGRGPGQSARDFNFPDKSRLLDKVSTAWGGARDQWQTFQRALGNVPTDEPCTRLTRDSWMTPLLGVLDYELQPVQGGIDLDGQTFRISHRLGEGETPTPVHIVGARQDLDERAQNHRQAPHSLVQDYLNRGEAVWGLVTNGTSLRLLRNSQRVRRHAWLEFDLQTLFDGEHFSDFRLLYRMLHRTRLPQSAEQAESCYLDKWYTTTVEQGGRIREKLRVGVEAAMRDIANGLLEHPANSELRAEVEKGTESAKRMHAELLRLIYRLLFLMVTEERNVLCTNPVYRERYSIERLRKLCKQGRAYNSHTDLWAGLWSTFRLFHCEDYGQVLGVPPLNGDLFDVGRAGLLAESRLTNAALLKAIADVSLYQEGSGETRRRVNYSALDVEELGSVYESLLDLEPKLEVATGVKPRFRFEEGTQRKTTGSYYTPPELVDELVRTALVPIMEERLKGAKTAAEKEQWLLSITVCDPACGSGHFLLAAARRLAGELARVRAGGNEPSPTDYRRALRDVAASCIYGVDHNDMAVELCRVALWLESHVEGKPLSFLDHRIRCGDSLVGVRDLAVLAQGVPEGAYKPVTGDDPEVARELKRRNKEELKGQWALSFEPRKDVCGLVADRRVLFGDDDTPAHVRGKRKAFDALRISHRMLKDLEAADLWTAAFFARFVDLASVPTTEAVLKRLEGHTPVFSQFMHLAAGLRFFHWPLEFPEVFERGGFDVVLCNPPWERIKLQQEEFFSTRDKRIASAPNASKRNALIRQLSSANPGLWAEYEQAMHDAEAFGRFLRGSGQYPTTSRGDINTYSVFAERFLSLIRPEGRAGAVLPTGIATDDTNKVFFGGLATGGRLASLFDFENREGLFPAVDSRQKFCLLTARGKADIASTPAQFAFFLTRAAQLRDQTRTFPLAPTDFARISPNTKTCPIFRTSADAELTRKIYERVPVLINEVTGENPWNISFLRMFDMSNDSGLFRTREQMERDGFRLSGNRFVRRDAVYLPLYEAKMIHQFDHRFGSFDGIESRGSSSLPTPSEVEHANPAFVAQPWYWVEQSEVDSALAGWERQWLIGFRNVARATDERTCIFGVLPRNAVGHSMPLLLTGTSARYSTALLGNINSLTLDYVARQKVAGINLSYFYVQQFPILPASSYSSADLLFIVPRVLELTATAWDVQPFADDVWRDSDAELRSAIEHQWVKNRQLPGVQDDKAPVWYSAANASFPHPPFRWNDERRAQLRAELDAYYARLYGLAERDLRYILDPEDIHGPDFPGETFRVLKKNETERYGEYRTQRLVLKAWRQLENQTTPAIRSIEERMQEAAEQAHALVPREETWGFYGYSGGPASAGGGTGAFLWFNAREEMLDFIRQYLPFWNGGPVHTDVGRVVARVGKILDRLDGAHPGEAFRSQLNQTLQGYTQIGWWGRFGELMSGETAFARDTRKWFRSNTSAGEETGPVPVRDKGQFSELLQDYGL